MDTEMLLVIVETLLDTPHSNEAILDALIQHDGDPEVAAQYLNSASKKQSSEKKRRRAGLDGWLKQPKKPKTTDSQPEIPPVASTSRSTPRADSKPAVDLMTVLKQPPKTEQGVPKLPPLMLSTPAMVAEHTPCTLHPSILPPELACRLFYTMFDASRQWSRNKWWLFDRLSVYTVDYFASSNTSFQG
jgi:hypothetical protein